MRIAFLCPDFPPRPGGVSDYLRCLCQELALHSTHPQIGVWSAQPTPVTVPGVEIFHQEFPWNRLNLEKIEQKIRKWRPDALLIQYTPYLYGPRSLGIHPSLPLWVRGLSTRLGVPVILTAHELHYPVGLSPDRLLIGTPQLAQFLALTWLADSVWFTYEAPFRKFQKLAARTHLTHPAKFAWLPVGSTISPTQSSGLVPPALAALAKEEVLLLQFGSGHPSRLFNHSLRALERVRAGLPLSRPVTLAFLGMTDEEVRKKFKTPGPLIRGLGYLDSHETSAWIARADVILAPFIDGVSTRRTSAMAALAHARPLATTLAYSSDPSIDWKEFCSVTPAADPEAYARAVEELVLNPAQAEKLGQKGKRKYEAAFSWPLIAQKLLSWVQDSCAAFKKQ